MSVYKKYVRLFVVVFFAAITFGFNGVYAQTPDNIGTPHIEGGRPAGLREYPSTGVLTTARGLCTTDVIGSHTSLTDLHCVQKPLQFPQQSFVVVGGLQFGHPSINEQVTLGVASYVSPKLRYQSRSGNEAPQYIDVAVAVSNQNLITHTYPVPMVPAMLTLPRGQLSGVAPVAKGYGITDTIHPHIPSWLQVYTKPIVWRYPGEVDCHPSFAQARLACLFEDPDNPHANIILPGDSGGGMVNTIDVAGNVITETTQQPLVGTNTAFVSGTLALITDLSEPILNAELRKSIDEVESYYLTHEFWTVPDLPVSVNISDDVTTKRLSPLVFQIIHQLSLNEEQVNARIYNAYINTVAEFALRDCPVQLAVETDGGGTISAFRGYDGQMKADITGIGESGVKAIAITQTIQILATAPVACLHDLDHKDISITHTFTTSVYADAVVEVPDGRTFPLAVDTIPAAVVQFSILPVTAVLVVTPEPHQPYTNSLTVNYSLMADIADEAVTIDAIQVEATTPYTMTGCWSTESTKTDAGTITHTLNLEPSQHLTVTNVTASEDGNLAVHFAQTFGFNAKEPCVTDVLTRSIEVSVTVTYEVRGRSYQIQFTRTASIRLQKVWSVYLPVVQK